jgi:hypothetical protein
MVPISTVKKLALGSAAIVAASAVVFAAGTPVEARVTKIVIDSKASPAFNGESFGAAGQYETIIGRAFGELDPSDPHNSIIQDIDLAPRNARGRVEYMATFQLVKPVDMSKSSRLMWHDVPNRGGRLTIVPAERLTGDIGLSSGWQGDASGATAPGPNNDYVVVPVAKNKDGSPIPGKVMGRILNVAGKDSQPMIVHSNPVPYKPSTLDTSKATLTTVASETIDGKIGATAQVALGEVRCADAVSRHAGPDAGLPEERLRSQSAVPGRLPGAGPAGSGCRLRGIPRRRRVLQVRDPRRLGHAEPGRRQRHVVDHARRVAVGQLPARFPPSRFQPDRGRQATS